MVTITSDADDTDLSLLRLLQLVSPTLPIGAFTYSQGIEWAAETGWIGDTDRLSAWLESLIDCNLTVVDIPLLERLYRAWERTDETAARYWSLQLLAYRETSELRTEEQSRGRALCRLLEDLQLAPATAWRETLELTQAGGFALAAVEWGIPLREAALGYAWGWLENQVTAAVKIVPLGQTDGQRLLQQLSKGLPAAVDCGLGQADGVLGGATPALAIASSRHEAQYTRLFRS